MSTKLGAHQLSVNLVGCFSNSEGFETKNLAVLDHEIKAPSSHLIEHQVVCNDTQFVLRYDNSSDNESRYSLFHSIRIISDSGEKQEAQLMNSINQRLSTLNGHIYLFGSGCSAADLMTQQPYFFISFQISEVGDATEKFLDISLSDKGSSYSISKKIDVMKQ